MQAGSQTGITGINDVVSIERQGPIALVSLNNPPVNAASHAVRSGIWEAIETLQDDPDVKVIALYGEGRTFIAGADIREFGKPPQAPLLPEVCLVLERCATPVISICLSSMGHQKRRATDAFRSMCAAFRLSRLVKNTNPS